MIYLIVCKTTYTCKIGYSKTPVPRLSQLQCGNSLNLNLVAIVKGDKNVEKQLHKQFKANRIRGEWFYLTEEIISFFNVDRNLLKPIVTSNNPFLIDCDLKTKTDSCTTLYNTKELAQILFSTSYKTRDLVLYILLNIKKNTDYIELVQTKVCNKTNLSRNSFYSAVKELTVLNIICKKQIRQYWVNPKYIFNGNRKTFFQKKKPENIKVVHQLFATIK